jgi:hypothetical protein
MADMKRASASVCGYRLTGEGEACSGDLVPPLAIPSGRRIRAVVTR